MNLGVLLAAVYGFSGVALGAFAAHALKSRLDDYALSIMHTATQYQLVHAVVLLVCATALAPGRWQGLAVMAIGLGVLLFSGSLYVLALTGIRGFGAITPIGGVLLLAGWVCVGMAALRS